MTRFVHTADWQLGSTRRWLGADASARLAHARVDAIVGMGALAAREGADFLLVCGDVFDLTDVPDDVLHRALDALGTLSDPAAPGGGLPVHLLPGNHDPVGPGSLWERVQAQGLLPPGIRVHTEPGVVPVADGVELLVVPWPGKAPERDLVAEALRGLTPPPTGTVRVLAAHGAIDPSLSAGRRVDIDLAMVEQALADGVVHYVALGDHHAPAVVGAAGLIRYPGTPEPTDWRDASPGRVLLVDVEPEATVRVAEHVLGTWTFTSLEQRLASAADLDRLAQRLGALSDKPTHAVRLTLSGALTPADRAGLDRVLGRARARLAALVVRDDDLVAVPSLEDVDSSALGLEYVGFVDDAVTELAAAHRSGAGQETAAGAGGPRADDPDPRRPVHLPSLDAPDPGGDVAAQAAGDALVLLHTWAERGALARDAGQGGDAR